MNPQSMYDIMNSIDIVDILEFGYQAESAYQLEHLDDMYRAEYEEYNRSYDYGHLNNIFS